MALDVERGDVPGIESADRARHNPSHLIPICLDFWTLANQAIDD